MPRSSKKASLSSKSSCKILRNSLPNACPKHFILKIFQKLKNIFKKLISPPRKLTLQEKSILNNFLQFAGKTVEDVMIPRSDITAVTKNVTLEELKEVLIKFPHTRILVYEDNLDNIIGFIHIKDIFKIIAHKQDFKIQKVIRKPIIATPSMKLITLLTEMQTKRTHIAIVVDEYGGTDGITTIENIMEEIFGSIEDEHDEHLGSNNYKVLSPNTILASSRVKVEELEELLGVTLKNPNDECETISGLILAKTGNVPIIGTKINITEEVEAEVIDANPRTLKLVKLTLKNVQYFS